MTSLQIRTFIWTHKAPFFSCIFLIGLSIGCAAGPAFWQLVLLH